MITAQNVTNSAIANKTNIDVGSVRISGILKDAKWVVVQQSVYRLSSPTYDSGGVVGDMVSLYTTWDILLATVDITDDMVVVTTSDINDAIVVVSSDRFDKSNAFRCIFGFRCWLFFQEKGLSTEPKKNENKISIKREKKQQKKKQFDENHKQTNIGTLEDLNTKHQKDTKREREREKHWHTFNFVCQKKIFNRNTWNTFFPLSYFFSKN